MSDSAIFTICGAVIQVALIVVGFLTLWVKLKYGAEKAEQIEGKIDDNTHITRTQTKAATAAAVAAAKKADEVNAKLNGGVDDAIRKAIEPVSRALADHAETDEKNMAGILRAIGELSAKVESLAPKQQHYRPDER